MGGIQSVECDGAFCAKSCFGHANADEMIVVIGNGAIGDGLAPEHAVIIVNNVLVWLGGWV
jgi:hypothetical protein